MSRVISRVSTAVEYRIRVTRVDHGDSIAVHTSLVPDSNRIPIGSRVKEQIVLVGSRVENHTVLVWSQKKNTFSFSQTRTVRNRTSSRYRYG